MLDRIFLAYLVTASALAGGSFLMNASVVQVFWMGIAAILLPAAAGLALGTNLLDRWVEVVERDPAAVPSEIDPVES